MLVTLWFTLVHSLIFKWPLSLILIEAPSAIREIPTCPAGWSKADLNLKSFQNGGKWFKVFTLHTLRKWNTVRMCNTGENEAFPLLMGTILCIENNPHPSMSSFFDFRRKNCEKSNWKYYLHPSDTALPTSSCPADIVFVFVSVLCICICNAFVFVFVFTFVYFKKISPLLRLWKGYDGACSWCWSRFQWNWRSRSSGWLNQFKFKSGRYKFRFN